MPSRYVLIQIPKMASTWLDEVTRKVDVLAMRREPLRGALRVDLLGMRRAALCPDRADYPWSVYARYQYDRMIQNMILVNNAVVPKPNKWRFRNFLQKATGRVEKHTPWSGLPEWMREFPVVVVLRDVLSWHLSRWLYGTSFLTRSRFYRDGRISLQSPREQRFVEQWMGGEFSQSSWRNLSAEGYWHLTHHLDVSHTLSRITGSRPPGTPGIGFYTVRILVMLHRDPQQVFRLSESELEEYFASGRWRGDLCRGWFLRQERLVEDAHRVLVEKVGYRREDLEQALAGLPQKLNVADPGRKERARRELYGNEALCAQILHAERFALRYLLPGLTGEVSPAAAPPSSDRPDSPEHGRTGRSVGGSPAMRPGGGGS